MLIKIQKPEMSTSKTPGIGFLSSRGSAMDKVVKLDSVTPGVTFKEDSTLLGTEDVTPRTPRHGFKFQSHSANFKTGNC